MFEKGLIYAGATSIVFSAGVWTGLTWERRSGAENLAAAATVALQYAASASEVQQSATYTFGEIVRDATADPDSDNCALGLRGAERLNRLR
ncbi:hypothetical protein M3484_02445 [Pseudomonas sp. GX19020]|uniref:hypothetical protein n=1 Tax=Pseudomonas sp. GX19020 TaxID=2942277 RepID=UPI0020186BF4|nr:hypothetical protein [Pseudomonas sp. GX19020]MCL4065434.1 hypothetical protein [Pseudomonas sp. GX19020]